MAEKLLLVKRRVPGALGAFREAHEQYVGILKRLADDL